jgi:hypothetical protein
MIEATSYSSASAGTLSRIESSPMSVQAIAGVSPRTESRVMTVFPSISSTALGATLGWLYGCLPLRIFGPKLSTLLFALPTAPLGALMFLWTKVKGDRYVLTNQSLQIWNALGTKRLKTVPLAEIQSISTHQSPGQEFFRAADIRLQGANGQTLAVLKGVAEYAPFLNAIEVTLQSHRLVKSSLATIAARK